MFFIFLIYPAAATAKLKSILVINKNIPIKRLTISGSTTDFSIKMAGVFQPWPSDYLI